MTAVDVFERSPDEHHIKLQFVNMLQSKNVNKVSLHLGICNQFVELEQKSKEYDCMELHYFLLDRLPDTFEDTVKLATSKRASAQYISPVL